MYFETTPKYSVFIWFKVYATFINQEPSFFLPYLIFNLRNAWKEFSLPFIWITSTPTTNICRTSGRAHSNLHPCSIRWWINIQLHHIPDYYNQGRATQQKPLSCNMLLLYVHYTNCWQSKIMFTTTFKTKLKQRHSDKIFQAFIVMIACKTLQPVSVN